ncbi:MAG: hypothetical protein NTW03_16200, partial [Verrucomicrobia bacterium]|nr:hypothetical protein [Verrucomicrobiota bacterium]
MKTHTNSDSSTVDRLRCFFVAALAVSTITASALPSTVPDPAVTPPLVTGYLRREVYTNITGPSLSDLLGNAKFPDHPDLVGLVTSFEAPFDFDDNYGQRLIGFLLPSSTGEHVFYLSSDDQSLLFLSPDEDPAQKVQIAREDTWSPPRSWTNFGTRTNDANISAPIWLEAGRKYYVEAVMKENMGGDSLGVAWQVPGGLPPANGDPPIAGCHLSPYSVPPILPPQATITEPVNGAVFLAATTVVVRVQGLYDPASLHRYMDLYDGTNWISNNLSGEAGQTNWLIAFLDSLAPGLHVLSAVARDDFGNTSTSAPVSFTIVQLPTLTITRQPVSQTVLGGAMAYFYGEAQGTEPIAYQWLFKGNPIPGATSRALEFLVVSTNQAGGYSFFASNDGVKATSAVATLTVNVIPPQYFSGQPLSQGAVEGGSVVLTASAYAHPDPSLRWLFNGQPLLGATGQVLRLDPIRLDQSGTYAAVAANEAGTITSQVARVTVLPRGPLDQWTWRRPLPQGNDLRGLAYGNGIFTAVGRAGAAVSSSDGGITWRYASSGEMDLDCVAFGNGCFVALGTWWSLYATDCAVALHISTNGVNWSQHPVPELDGFPVADVVFGNGRFVAVSYYGRSAMSTDGLRWTVSSSLNWGSFGPIGYGNGLFVAMTSNDEYTPAGTVAHIAFSTDGLNWTEQSLGVPSILRDITWANGLFVACGSQESANGWPSAIFTSPDLVSWNSYPLPVTNSLVAIQNGGGRFVTVSGEEDGVIASSPDAMHWTVHRVPLSNGLYTLAYGAGRFAAAGNFGNLLTSTNGETWILQSTGSETNLRGVARGEGGYVAVGNEGLLLTSSNGIAWTPQPRPTSNNLRGVAFGAGRFTAVGENDRAGGTILVSSNGTAWTRVNSSTNTGRYDIIYAADRFVAVGDKGTIVVSRDGLTWTTGSSSTAQKLNSVAWGAGTFVAVGKETTVVTSPDGTNWTRSLGSDDGVFLQGVAYGNGVFVAAGKGGTVLTATNL